MKTDSEIQRDVIDALHYEPKLNSAAIGVFVKDGIVNLLGLVNSFNERMTAGKVAEKVNGVKGILMDVDVKIPRQVKHPRDFEIARTAKEIICNHTSLINKKIGVSVNNGILTLTGEADHWYQKHDAERAVSKLAGVRFVRNNIKVKNLNFHDNLEKAIQKAFKRTATIVHQNIQIEITNSEVILKGQQPSILSARSAEITAFKATGIADVKNNIKIVPREFPNY